MAKKRRLSEEMQNKLKEKIQMTIETIRSDKNDKLGLSPDDVIKIIETTWIASEKIITLEEMIKRIYSQPQICQLLSEEGYKCEILSSNGGGWQKGRFRFKIEFIPENPEAFLKNSTIKTEKIDSPLDDLRLQLNKD